MKPYMRIIMLALVFVCITMLLSAMGNIESTTESERLQVAVSILPQKYFVERIAGDLVDTAVLVGVGQSPHDYQPTPNQMAQLAMAKVWFLSNTDFENSLKDKVAALYPGLRIVDGTEGVVFRTLEEHHHEGELAEENPVESVEAEGIEIDRHTWLGRQPSKILASHIKDTLVGFMPGQKALLEENYGSLVADIDAVFNGLTQKLVILKGRTVFVYHPSFGYFLDEFGINQESVETGGKEPTAKALSLLIEEARADHAAAIFVQAQFSTSAAKTVADAVGAQVVALDPLASDWLENIQAMGEALLNSVETQN
ncbi:MAG: metal ABC transporter solute-binding protein, Zn/Mn family [Sphaerochaetaceae bacterium]